MLEQKVAMISFEHVRIVLVEPQHSGNMGAIARAMHNFGFKNLALVNPVAHHLNREACDRAMQAQFILKEAKIYHELAEAVAHSERVIGMSGKKHFPVKKTPREFVLEDAQVAGRSISLVFGPEDAGLRKEHLAFCDEIVHIPVNEEFSSINLSHAVMVLLYEMVASRISEPVKEEKPLVNSAQKEEFYQHLKETLTNIEYLGPRKPNHTLDDLKAIFSRAKLDEREIRIVRGVLRQMDQALRWAKEGRSSS